MERLLKVVAERPLQGDVDHDGCGVTFPVFFLLILISLQLEFPPFARIPLAGALGAVLRAQERLGLRLDLGDERSRALHLVFRVATLYFGM